MTRELTGIPRLLKRPLFHSPLIGLATLAGLMALIMLTAGNVAAEDSGWESWFAKETNGLGSEKHTIQWAEFTHQIHFAPKKSRITPAERERLHGLIYGQGLGRGEGDLSFIVAQPNFASARADRLNIRRERTIREFLRWHQMYPRTLGGNPNGKPVNVGGTDSVTLVIRRPLVVAKACKDWDRLRSGKEINGGTAGFGCMTARSLQMQVANPGDLVRGREMGPMDGTVGAAAIDRYRRDKVKRLIKTDTGAGSGSGGGSN